jgi:ADP-heptose:LPS heptosyltransferase
MYRSGTPLEIVEYNFPLNQGGLGDLIGQLPAIVYCLDHHPQIIIHLVVHEYAVPLCKKVFQKYGERVNVVSLTNAINGIGYDENRQARSPYAHKIGNLSWHITEHAFATMVGRNVEDKYKNYIKLDPVDVSHFALPKDYIVVTTAYTSKTRMWNKKSIDETCDYIISKGYTPVYLGKSFTKAYEDKGIVGNMEADYSKGVNVIDKTDLFEAHGIMANAKAVVGLDNGLCPHLAAMSDVPIVVAFTSVLKEHRLPYRNNIMGYNCYPIESKELQCNGCQSNMNFASTSFSFTQCFYSDYLCTEMLSSDKFINELEKIL